MPWNEPGLYRGHTATEITTEKVTKCLSNDFNSYQPGKSWNKIFSLAFSPPGAPASRDSWGSGWGEAPGIQKNTALDNQMIALYSFPSWTGLRRWSHVRASPGPVIWSVHPWRSLSSDCKRVASLLLTLIWHRSCILGQGGTFSWDQHDSMEAVFQGATEEATLSDPKALSLGQTCGSWLSFQRSPIPGSLHENRPSGGHPKGPPDGLRHTLAWTECKLQCPGPCYLEHTHDPGWNICIWELLQNDKEEWEVGGGVEDPRLASSCQN